MISYKKLWKLLIDKEIKKSELVSMAGLSPYVIKKLNHNENVNAETLAKMHKAETKDFIPKESYDKGCNTNNDCFSF